MIDDQATKNAEMLKRIQDSFASQLMEYFNVAFWDLTPDIETQLMILNDQRFQEELAKNGKTNLVIKIQAQTFGKNYNYRNDVRVSVTDYQDNSKIKLTSFEKIILNNDFITKKIDELPSMIRHAPRRLQLDTYIQINDWNIFVILGRIHVGFFITEE